MNKDPSDRPRPSAQRRRRAADPRRKNDPERTRRSILAAAKEEFGRHGFEGARVARIAQTAGVGHQLITYHFGGKKGLFEALEEQWLNRSFEIQSAADGLVAMTREFVFDVLRDEAWARALALKALEGGFPIRDMRVARLIELVETSRIHQKRGEIRDDIDVGAVSLALFAACIAPVILPAFARAFVGLDPSSDSFAELYAHQLGQMVAALAEPGPGPAPGSPDAQEIPESGAPAE